jgi:tRNA U34 5-methylaminomethyl-2-thiouridine-forming methyltransferase MnmC
LNIFQEAAEYIKVLVFLLLISGDFERFLTAEEGCLYMYERVETGDGSITFFSEKFNQIYHSKSGAEEEARKKFVEPCDVRGRSKKGKLRILDICFGIGYNTAAALDAVDSDCVVEIVGLEDDRGIIQKMDEVTPNFSSYKFLKGLTNDDEIKKEKTTVKILIGDARQKIKELEGEYDVIFLDPFSPKACPELWTPEFFKDIRKVIAEDGVLATYSCARMVRDNMKEAGFTVEDIAPVGRRAPGTLARPIALKEMDN